MPAPLPPPPPDSLPQPTLPTLSLAAISRSLSLVFPEEDLGDVGALGRLVGGDPHSDVALEFGGDDSGEGDGEGDGDGDGEEETEAEGDNGVGGGGRRESLEALRWGAASTAVAAAAAAAASGEAAATSKAMEWVSVGSIAVVVEDAPFSAPGTACGSAETLSSGSVLFDPW